MVTEVEDKIINILHDRKLIKDDILGLMCVLRQKNACGEMLEWLEENEQAYIEEISEKVLDILNE